MSKGQETRKAILDAALDHAGQVGLQGLSIGSMAERVGMSKSGLFAHFGSKEEMQIAVLREAQARFLEHVFEPARQLRRGLPRLRALFVRWIEWRIRAGLPGGCVLSSASHEFDDQPGPVRDAVAQGVQSWNRLMEHAIQMAMATGELRPDTDPALMAFEIRGVILATLDRAGTHRRFGRAAHPA